MVLRRKNIPLYSEYCSMNKQYVEKVKNRKRLTWWEESKIVMLLNRSLTGFETRLSCSKNRSKRDRKNEFLDCHVTSQEVSTGLAHSLKEVIIYCLSKSSFHNWNIFPGFLWPHAIFQLVAAGISNFCLARNLIRLLGSTHNFTQSGWLILFHPNHLSEQQ